MKWFIYWVYNNEEPLYILCLIFMIVSAVLISCKIFAGYIFAVLFLVIALIVNFSIKYVNKHNKRL